MVNTHAPYLYVYTYKERQHGLGSSLVPAGRQDARCKRASTASPLPALWKRLRSVARQANAYFYLHYLHLIKCHFSHTHTLQLTLTALPRNRGKSPFRGPFSRCLSFGSSAGLTQLQEKHRGGGTIPCSAPTHQRGARSCPQAAGGCRQGRGSAARPFSQGVPRASSLQTLHPAERCRQFPPPPNASLLSSAPAGSPIPFSSLLPVGRAQVFLTPE